MRQQSIDECWGKENRIDDPTVSCYLRNWMDQLCESITFDEAYEQAMDQLSKEGSTRGRCLVAQHKATRKHTGRCQQLFWGSKAKTEEYVTHQLAIGEPNFDVVDFGEAAPLADHCRKVIFRPDIKETKRCTILHRAAALEWDAKNRGDRIPLRSRVFQLAQQARMEEASVARMIEKSTIDAWGGCENSASYCVMRIAPIASAISVQSDYP